MIILPRGGLEGRCNLIIQEGGEALDSGRYSRKDRHSAVPPDEARLAEIQIEADENFQSKGEINARKAWAAYKEKRGLTEQHIRDALQVNVDHKMLCFSALTPECKNPKQRKIDRPTQMTNKNFIYG